MKYALEFKLTLDRASSLKTDTLERFPSMDDSLYI